MVSEQNILLYLLVIVISYLIGSLPTAYLIARTRKINIFDVGSGNMGGTNIARAMGLGWGLLTSFVDICKGIAAIIIARAIMPNDQWAATTIAAIVVIIGHNWSLFATLFYLAASQGRRLTVRGGKGAATAFGTVIMILPVQTVVMMLALGVSLVVITRYVSLSVLLAFALAIVWMVILIGQGLLPLIYLVYGFGLSLLLILRFRENIQRLIAGNERKLGDRVNA